MSFTCQACARQRAGSPAEGEAVCAECCPTQMGRAALLLKHFEPLRIDEARIREFEAVLDEAQTGPPDGAADGSVPVRVWTALAALARAARSYNHAVENVPLAVQLEAALAAIDRQRVRP